MSAQRPHADDRGGAAVRGRRDQQDGERARGLSVRGLQEPVPRGLARWSEGHHDLPAEQRHRLGARGHQGAGAVAQRVAAGPEGRSGPARAPRLDAAAGAGKPASGRVARISPRATSPGPTWSRFPSAGNPSPSSSARSGNPAVPFEVWVNGAEQPRGLGAIAKALSMDMRSEDRAWLKMKLDALAQGARRAGLRDPDAADRRQAVAERRRLGIRQHRALALRAARRVQGTRSARHAGTECAVLQEGAEGRTARHDELDRGHRQCEHRRRLRARREGTAPARRQPAAVFDLARRRVSEGARRPVQADLARHARRRCRTGSA